MAGLAPLLPGPARAGDEVRAVPTRGGKPERVGRVVYSQGAVRIERGGPALQASAGHEVLRGDRVETAADARTGIVLDDGTRLALGQRTSLTVLRFMSEKGRQTGAVLLRLARGALRLSVEPSKRGRNKRVEVRTAAARVEGAAYDAVFDVRGQSLSMVLLAGRAEVRNLAGSVEVDKPRRAVEGVTATLPPSRASGWHRDRIARVLEAIEGRQPVVEPATSAASTGSAGWGRSSGLPAR